jgi:restriction system protein
VFHGATLRSVDAMDGTRFEEFLAQLFGHLGYRVQLVGRSHDFGADLVLTSRRQRIVVQAKRYGGNVGIAAVQEVVGAVLYYHGTRGMVVTSSGFTDSARELAVRSGVELWDRQRLAAAMARTGGRGRSTRQKPAYNKDKE